MKVEVICGDLAETKEMPPDVDIVGFKLTDNGENIMNVNTGWPETLGGAAVGCDTRELELSGGVRLTLYLYRLGGAAGVLSLKSYAGLVFCDISFCNMRIILTA